MNRACPGAGYGAVCHARSRSGSAAHTTQSPPAPAMRKRGSLHVRPSSVSGRSPANAANAAALAGVVSTINRVCDSEKSMTASDSPPPVRPVRSAPTPPANAISATAAASPPSLTS